MTSLKSIIQEGCWGDSIELSGGWSEGVLKGELRGSVGGRVGGCIMCIYRCAYFGRIAVVSVVVSDRNSGKEWWAVVVMVILYHTTTLQWRNYDRENLYVWVDSVLQLWGCSQIKPTVVISRRLNWLVIAFVLSCWQNRREKNILILQFCITHREMEMNVKMIRWRRRTKK